MSARLGQAYGMQLEDSDLRAFRLNKQLAQTDANAFRNSVAKRAFAEAGRSNGGK